MIKILIPLNPVVFYLKSDNVKATIGNVASERLSDNYDLYPDWIDWMVAYVKNSRYGNKFGVKDQNDLLDYFSKRVEIEDYVFESLDVSRQAIHIDKIDKDSQNKMIYDIVTRML